MNIFMLHEDPEENVKLHCDKHVVKMILEYAQMLSTAHRMLDGTQYIDDSSGRRIKRWRMDHDEEVLYKASHINHPCTIWARDNCANYGYLYILFCSLCSEYTYRYGKIHLTWRKLGNVLATPPKNITHASWINLPSMPQCMPEEYKDINVISAYRRFYRNDKIDFAKYTRRDTPNWMVNNADSESKDTIGTR